MRYGELNLDCFVHKCIKMDKFTCIPLVLFTLSCKYSFDLKIKCYLRIKIYIFFFSFLCVMKLIGRA